MTRTRDLEKAESPSEESRDETKFGSETASPPAGSPFHTNENLKRALSARQVSMIAIGGTIGTGLFLGTGKSLATGGPGSLLLNYSIVGGIVYLVMLCLGEMATEFPLAGSFITYSARFVDEPFGFSLGWNYVFNDAISMASDLTASELLIAYWTPNYNWVPALVFWFVLVGLNLFHVGAYGELEYWLSLLKVLSVVIFFFLGIAVNAGANVTHTYLGATNWTLDAAPFVDGFRGFASIFVTASFAFGGVESIGVTAGETRNPSRNMPRVINLVFWRIILFYVLTIVIIGFNVPYNYPGLSTKSTATSPFTIVFQMAGAKAGGSFMNVVILTSVLSAGNHALFAGSRVLYGMAVIGQAPRLFTRTNRNGVPWISVLAVSSVGIIFFGASFLKGSAGQIWNWAQNLVGVSNQIAWLCIGVASWRFRSAWVAQGRDLRDLKFPNPAGRFAAPIVVVSTSVIILVQGWSAFSPSFDVQSFVANYVELPLFALLYVGWRIGKRSRSPALLEIDLDSGRHQDGADEQRDEEKLVQREAGKLRWFWKVYGTIA